MLRLLYVFLFFFQFSHAIAQPDARVCANLIYHHQLRKVLLLDGYSSEPLAEKTKIWALEDTEWKLISADGPLTRSFGGVAYDIKRNKVVLFGGRLWSKGKQNTGNDTWEWDGQKWTQVSPAFEPLAQRDHIAMTYDEANAVTILAGGVQLNKKLDDYIWPNDLWTWDGKTWTQHKAQMPFERFSSMAYDSKKHELIIFGVSHEEESEALVNETWIWNGVRWRKHNGINPPARSAVMAMDSDKGVILLYGGWKKSGERRTDDMWQWNGTDWQQIHLTGNTPGKRGGHSMAYDASRKKIILFGGESDAGALNDTWEWDGTQWLRVH